MPSILQDNNSKFPLLKYKEGYVLAFLKCTDNFRMDPKCYTSLNGPTSGFPLNLLPLDFHSREILLTIAIMKEGQHINLLEIDWSFHLPHLFSAEGPLKRNFQKAPILVWEWIMDVSQGLRESFIISSYIYFQQQF